MRVLGLTGSIAMGKSTAAAIFRRLGIPVYDSDAVVHSLLSSTAVQTISAVFPDVIVHGAVDRLALGARVWGDFVQLQQLESILHPLVRQAERRFLQRAATNHKLMVVLDIPLLFETNGEQRCDAVAVVTAPQFLQTQRAMRRVGMTLKKLESIRRRQIPENEKRRRATFVVQTGLGYRSTLRRLMKITETMCLRPSHHWPPRPRKDFWLQGGDHA